MFSFDGRMTFLAPLAGYSDTAFRSMCRELGADVVSTGMVNAIGLTSPSSNKTKKRYARFHHTEKPIGIQLFGNDPGVLADAAARSEELGFNFVDINMGCSVKKILKTGSGATLLGEKKLAFSIVDRIRKTIRLPLSVKMRTGRDERDNSFLDFAYTLAEAGADAIAIHPRTVAQGMEGRADHKKTALIRKKVTGTYIIANGDIETVDDARRVYEQTGCNGVMIGRGALRNPLIFSKIGGPGESDDGFFLGGIVLEHFIRFNSLYGGKAPHFFRKYVFWYTKELPEAAILRKKLSNVSDPEVMKGEIKNFFEKNCREHS